MRALILALSVAIAFGTTACGRHASSGAAATHAKVAASSANQGRGADIFRANCAVCHTATGAAAGVGPSLEHEKSRKNYDQTVTSIEQPEPPMPKLYPSPLSEKDVSDVAAYVQSL